MSLWNLDSSWSRDSRQVIIACEVVIDIIKKQLRAGEWRSLQDKLGSDWLDWIWSLVAGTKNELQWGRDILQARQGLYSWATVPTYMCHSLKMYHSRVGEVAQLVKCLPPQTWGHVKSHMLWCVYNFIASEVEAGGSQQLVCQTWAPLSSRTMRNAVSGGKTVSDSEDQPWRYYLTCITTFSACSSEPELTSCRWCLGRQAAAASFL